MRLPLSWLSDFVDWSVTDPAIIAERLSLATAEIEEVEQQGKYLTGVVVGRIENLLPHPKADRLRLADVDTGKGLTRVVCGGTNLRTGMLVAFAPSGTTVRWHGGEEVTLEPAVIRGEKSDGMICAAEEIGLDGRFPPSPADGERPIVDLSAQGFAVGAKLKEVLGLDDVVFVISNTAITHRPDLFSIVGFARECIALELGTWKKSPETKLPKFPKKGEVVNSANETDAITRYFSCAIDVSAIGRTPDWMARRLVAAGWRPVSLPVDITNYVATETGMPMHSFDLDDIKGTMRMRESKASEKIVTLDGVERELPEGAIVISDDEGIFDLLGIMGGLRSSTKETTKRILLHAAVVDPRPIRRAMLATGHRTDAGTVYEKGIPDEAADRGFARALELMLELVPGAVVASPLHAFGKLGETPAIRLSIPKLHALLGAEVPARDIRRIFRDIECAVTGSGSALSVRPPMHRRRDLKNAVDLAEEIGRLYGYANIAPALPHAALRAPERPARLHRLRDGLAARGATEVCPLSLVGPQLLKRAGVDPVGAVRIKNPLGEDTSLHHPTGLPRLLEHAARILPGRSEPVWTFQTAHVSGEKAPEHLELATVYAPVGAPSLVELPALILGAQLRELWEADAEELSVSPLATAPGWAHPGRAAALNLRGDIVGVVAELHPAVIAAFGLPERTAAATVDLSAALAAPLKPRQVTAAAAFPAISYDVTVKADARTGVAALLERVRAADPLVESAAVADAYAAAQAADGAYNLTLRLTYRAADRTLAEADVQPLHDRIVRDVIALPLP